jgi:hypothetical protein
MTGRARMNAIAFLALLLALTSGVAQAANTVSSTDIINGEVKSVDIGTGQVKSADISPANVTEAKLANAAVTGAKVADGAIATAKLLDGAITTAKLADGAVNGAKVLDDSLTGADVANTNSLRSPEIAGLTGADIDESTLFNDNSLTTADLADAAVTIPKLDFDPATQAEFDQLATDDGDPPNTGSNLVNWNRLVGVPADIADGDLAGWSLSGNAGTTGTDFLGTTDNQPLELRVNGARAMRLEPASDGANPAPNVI